MNFDDASLLSLFQLEAKTQALKLSDGLIALEFERSPAALEELMRAAHSLKGAARIVGHEGVAAIAHELEECFVAAQGGKLEISGSQIDVLLRGVDVMAQTALSDPEVADTDESARALEAMLAALRSIERGDPAGVVASAAARPHGNGAPPPSTRLDGASYDTDRLLTLASEALVATRALVSTVESEGGHYRSDQEIERAFDVLRAAFRSAHTEAPPALDALHAAVGSVLASRRERAVALDSVSQRVSSAVSHLYEGVLDARMLPFGDGIVGLPRLVRDTARTLGREVTLVTSGETTPVDREVLRRLDAPLGHLIRNAVDHGIESSHERLERGKPPRGTIRVEARHGGGRLLVSVQDDGRGLDFAAVRARVVGRGLAEAQAVAEMSDSELSHFLFLPGFTMRDEVTPISGRGVGLDAVQMSVREIGGDVRLVHPPSGGMRFDLQLPLTLSVIRALVVLIGDEPYAFPLARVHRIVRVESSELASVEGRQHFTLDGRQVGLVWGHQLLDIGASVAGESMCVVVIGDHEATWGIVVDRFMGEQELVLRGLDARLQKVQDIGGASLLPDGSPLLVLEVDAVLRTASTLAAGGRLDPLRKESAPS
jgi:two-component system sensor histidine kinase and response regulator WspE